MDFWHRILNNIASAAPGTWLAVIGSLAGVFLGAMIPIIKAYVDRFLENRRERKKIAIFFSHKLGYMISSIQLIQLHFEEGISRASKNPGSHPGMLTQAMNRICDEVSFSEENIWAIAQICGAKGINALGFLDNQFNVLVRGVDHYAKLRSELQNIMPKIKVVDERTVSYEIEPDNELSGEVMVRIAELDNMVATLFDHAKRNKAATASALKVLLEAKKFPYPKMQFVFDPATELPPIGARRARLHRQPSDRA